MKRYAYFADENLRNFQESVKLHNGSARFAWTIIIFVLSGFLRTFINGMAYSSTLFSYPLKTGAERNTLPWELVAKFCL